MSDVTETEMQPGLTVEEKQNLISDLNTLADGLSELDRGVVANIVSINAMQKVLVDKGVISAEELVTAMQEIYKNMQEAAQQKIDAMEQAQDDLIQNLHLSYELDTTHFHDKYLQCLLISLSLLNIFHNFSKDWICIHHVFINILQRF